MIFIIIILNKSMEKKYNYYSQTDSLTYEIKTEDFWNDKGKFDQ